MSSGKNHEKINVVVLVVLLLGSSLFQSLTITGYFVFGICGYVVGTYYLNPDLDIVSRPYMRWGLIRFIWFPYRKLIVHRSVLSHGHLIGDILRHCYLIIVMSPFLISIITSNPLFLSFLKENLIYYISFFIGNCISSSIHIGSDHISTNLKKFKF